MNNKFDLFEIIKKVRTPEFLKNCNIPLGYSAGLPIIQTLNSSLCITIPFLKYKITGKVDETLVYPIRYTLTFKLPQKLMVKFEDLSIHPAFRRVEFNKPVGLFRHDAIKSLTKTQYESEKNKLYDYYNKIIDSKLNSIPCENEIIQEFKRLLNTLVEPSIKVIYKVIDNAFYNEYMS